MTAQPRPAETSTRPYAVLARRAVRQMIAARRAGDRESAEQFGRLAAEFVDAHLAQIGLRP
jgi:hypothetical protein